MLWLEFLKPVMKGQTKDFNFTKKPKFNQPSMAAKLQQPARQEQFIGDVSLISSVDRSLFHWCDPDRRIKSMVF